jgi:hypothetical protein
MADEIQRLWIDPPTPIRMAAGVGNVYSVTVTVTRQWCSDAPRLGRSLRLGRHVHGVLILSPQSSLLKPAPKTCAAESRIRLDKCRLRIA